MFNMLYEYPFFHTVSDSYTVGQEYFERDITGVKASPDMHVWVQAVCSSSKCFLVHTCYSNASVDAGGKVAGVQYPSGTSNCHENLACG